MSAFGVSPVTKSAVPVTVDSTYGFRLWGWDHSKFGLGHLLVSEEAYKVFANGEFKRYVPYDETITSTENQRALNLIRSYLWRNKQRAGSSVLVTTSKERDAIQDAVNRHWLDHNYLIRSFTDFVREALALTLPEMARQTLHNLYSLWESEVVEEDGERILDSKLAEALAGASKNGLVYGCDHKTYRFVLNYLTEGGYLRENTTFSSFQSASNYITAKGFDLIDTLRRTAVGSENLVFLVRRWDTDLDEMLTSACEEVFKKLNVRIAPVWSEPHNEKIDERVFRQIRQARAIVVDLTPDSSGKGDRINVGLEAGYAMAIGKPIIAIRRKPLDEDPDWKKNLPFDIVTLNTYNYSQDATTETITELANVLIARVGLAISV